MSSVPLIRLSQLHPFVRAIEGLGGQPDTLLRAASLPVYGLFESSEALVSERTLWAFLQHAESSVGEDATGWLIGEQSEVHDIGEFGAKLMHSDTLGRAISLLSADVADHSSHAQFGVEPAGDDVWFWRRGLDGIDVGRRPTEQYVLSFMLKLVRAAAGQGWRPLAIRLQEADVAWTRNFEVLCDVPTECCSPLTAIRMPRVLLALGMTGPPRAARDRPTGSDTPRPDFLGSLRQALVPLVGQVALSVELGAELSGTSVRSLQRRLAGEGTSWSDETDALRFERACHLLDDPDYRVTDVAHALGYSDAAHFNRAFRRWTGVPPREYRGRARPEHAPA